MFKYHFAKCTSDTEKMKYFSMFSGIGGFELGIQRATKGEWECVGFSEIDKYAIQVYKKHFPKHKNYGCATEIDTNKLSDFDFLCGGFPCQAFSNAGKRRGFQDTRGTLFFEIARVLEAKRPKAFLLENVKGLLSHNKGETFKIIIETLDKLGYQCQWMVLSSGFYTQQDRQRVYIFGVLRGENGGHIFSEMGFMGELDKRASKTLPTISTKPIGRGECIIIEAKGKRRWLTIKECERLQGFPDDWTKGVSYTQRFKQCGNAVTVNVIEEIMSGLMDMGD